MSKLFYRKYKNNNSQSKGFGKWYGRAVITETVDIESIATKMQDNCTVKRADILAVLSELGPVITDMVKDSKRVRIPYLGCFKLGITTTGEEDPEKFSVRNNVVNVHVIFQPETKAGEIGKRIKAMVEGVVVTELPDRNPSTGTADDEPADTDEPGSDEPGSDDGENARP